MKFNEALDLLKQGKQVHRKEWPIEEGYLTLMQGMKSVWKILLKPNPNAGNHLFLMEDFDGEDWDLYEHKKTE